MAQGPAVSVIVTLYNKRQYICRAVKSVLDQTVADLELLVVDDGSTDGGAEAIEPFLTDSRLRVVRQGNSGVSAARNRGVRESRGDVVAFLDADDEFLPGHLEALLSLARRFPNAGLLGTGYYTVASDGQRALRQAQGPGVRVLENYFEASCRYGYFLTPSGCGIRRLVFDAVGGFLEGVAIGEDLEYWARVALRYPVAYDANPTALYYRSVPGSAMSGFRWGADTPPVANMLSRILKCEALPGLRQSVIDYAAWILLNHAASGIATSHQHRAREVLRHPLLAASSFAARRKLLLFAASLPHPVLRTYLHAREFAASVFERRAAMWWIPGALKRTEAV